MTSDTTVNPAVTANDLFEAQEQRLQLKWLAGKEIGDILLESTTAKFPGLAMVGHLNFIHPNRIQIISEIELQYINNLDENEKQRAVNDLFLCESTVVVVLTTTEHPDYLIAAAQKAGKPLFASSQPSPVVIEHLQYYLTRALAPRLTTHGVYLEVMGMGVLIIGESGIGKSELALELLSRNHRLIADDAVDFIKVGPDVLVGECPKALTDYLEVRGLGILDVRAMFGETAVRHKKKLHLIVHLKKLKQMDQASIDRLQAEQLMHKLLDVDIPEVILFVAPGRNLAVLVEAATRSYILRVWGLDVLGEFTKRHQELINKSTK